jgi:hypothetical protein
MDIKQRFFIGPASWFWSNLVKCHSEGATRSKSKSKKIKVKRDVPKAKATEESPVQAGWKNQFDLTQQKTELACGNERFFVGRSLSTKQ